MKKFCSFFITIINFSLIYSLRTPSISQISQLTIVDLGGTAELSCTVSNAMDFPVVWLKINKEIYSDPVFISNKNFMIIRDSRFSLRMENDLYDDNSTKFILQINEIQETNTGFYQCSITLGTNRKISADVELVVRQPPTISDNSTRSLVVLEGDSVKMECYANGYPPPTILWKRADNMILSGNRSIHRGNVLEVSNITKEDRGTYYCCATNGVYRSARRSVAVEVKFAPVITVPKYHLEQALQYDIDVVCNVEAYPPPAIVWLDKDKTVLTNNQHNSISQFTTTDEITESTLRIITIEKRQYGNYTCKAFNILGTTEATVQVFESILPAVCPPACGPKSTKKSSSTRATCVDLSWLVAAYFLCVFLSF